MQGWRAREWKAVGWEDVWREEERLAVGVGCGGVDCGGVRYGGVVKALGQGWMEEEDLSRRVEELGVSIRCVVPEYRRGHTWAR